MRNLLGLISMGIVLAIDALTPARHRHVFHVDGAGNVITPPRTRVVIDDTGPAAVRPSFVRRQRPLRAA